MTDRRKLLRELKGKQPQQAQTVRSPSLLGARELGQDSTNRLLKHWLLLELCTLDPSQCH